MVFPVYGQGALLGVVDLLGLLWAGLATRGEGGRIDGPTCYREEDLLPLYPGDMKAFWCAPHGTARS